MNTATGLGVIVAAIFSVAAVLRMIRVMGQELALTALLAFMFAILVLALPASGDLSIQPQWRSREDSAGLIALLAVLLAPPYLAATYLMAAAEWPQGLKVVALSALSAVVVTAMVLWALAVVGRIGIY